MKYFGHSTLTEETIHIMVEDIANILYQHNANFLKNPKFYNKKLQVDEYISKVMLYRHPKFIPNVEYFIIDSQDQGYIRIKMNGINQIPVICVRFNYRYDLMQDEYYVPVDISNIKFYYDRSRKYMSINSTKRSEYTREYNRY